MRWILPLVLMLGCSQAENPKVEIVDRQRVIKKELTELEMKFISEKFNDTIKDEKEVERKFMRGFRYDSLKYFLQKEYDSLEMELKKY